MLKLRKMTFFDSEAVYTIEKETFPEPWSLESIQEEIDNDKALYLVAILDEEIVGYCGLWHILDEGHITNIAVAQSHRKCGIGEKMVREMLKYGEEQGIISFTLEVRESNEPAKALYSKLGFVVAGSRKNFYSKPKENAAIMWRHKEEELC